jgi:hypothetical protein
MTRYRDVQLKRGVSMKESDVLALILCHVIYSAKVVNTKNRTVTFSKEEVDRLRAKLGYGSSWAAQREKILYLSQLGYVQVLKPNHYRITESGRIQVKLIGLYLKRLLKKYHNQNHLLDL